MHLKLKLCRTENTPLKMTMFTGGTSTFKLSIGSITQGGTGGRFPIYEGEYLTVSDVHCDTILETERKSLLENIVISKVPQAEVSNDSGGKTLIIGG